MKTSYLQKLRFDPKLSQSLIAKYLANPRLVLLLLFSVIILGITSYLNLPRRLNPEVKIPLVIVSTVLPGANPQDIESLITEPLENSVRALEDVSTVNSTSQDSASVLQIEFASGVDPEKARVDVQSAIDQVELPEDAQTPQVQKIDFENQPVWSFVLTGADLASLTRFATSLRDELENLPTIDRVRTGGLEEQEISVVIEPEKIATYGINPMQISQLVKAGLSSFPAGSVESDSSVFTLSLDPSVVNIDDLRNLKLNLNGLIVPLSSVATITEKSKPNTSTTYFASATQMPTRTIVFDVFKTSTTNIDEAVKAADETVSEQLAQHAGVFSVKTVMNTGELIDEQFTDLIRDFALTTILVFIVLFIFLGARQAFVSFFAVPLTFFISFTVMNLSGISLNFLSMFSLLLSLGLLVDDTIVVISAMTSYYRTGKFTPLQTGLLVWRDFLIPILTTTLTTVWAFLPLLLSTGIIGEFIKSIPIVVSSTLLASFVVAMFMTLPLMILLLKPTLPRRVVILLRILLVLVLLGVFLAIAPKGIFLPFSVLALLAFLFVTAKARLNMVKKTRTFVQKQQEDHESVRKAPHFFETGLISFQVIGSRYRRILTRILATKENRRKAVIMVVVFSLFSYLLLPLGFVKNDFFPSSDAENLFVSLELPAGTKSDITKSEAVRLLNQLRTTQDTSYVIADIGQAMSEMGGTTGAGSNNVLFSFTLPKREDRERSSIELAENLRTELSSYTKGKVTVSEVSGGPPAGADVQIKLFGEDLATLDSYADNLVSYLETQPGVADPTKSIKPGMSKLVFIPQSDTMAQNNITSDQLGIFLRTFASGLTLETAKLTGGDDDEDITLRLGNGQQEIESVYALSLPTQTGNIPLSQLGTLELRPNPTLITREDGERTISVTASVTEGFTTSEVNQKLTEFADSQLNLPEGYRWETGGVNEENQNSVTSILMAMLLSFLLIIVTMVIQFSSFRKAIIVMLVIPLSISGVFIIFALTGTPLSFPALIGVLALFGIVVKNSILIVDKITANQKIGMPFTESIIDATESRLEPIALTSFAAIMGLIPVTISDPLWRGLGGAIIAGLTFSGTIMLFFIPVVYYLWFNPNPDRVTKKRGRR